jgi:hypothetical protein
MARAQSFFLQLYHDPEMHAQHMDGLHFMTESLLQLWTVINNNRQPSKRNVALRSLYASAQEAKAYEDVIKAEVFDVVFASYILSMISLLCSILCDSFVYTNRKKVYQQAAVPVDKINKITQVQDAQANRFISPLISFDAFRDFMANRGTRKGKNQPQKQDGKEGAPLTLLPYFLQERVRLRAVKYLPVLVNFYKLITSTFSHRITEQQALELSVPQCIDIVRTMERSVKTTNLAETLTNKWEEFQKAWSRI